jgi:hypothetical protein
VKFGKQTVLLRTIAFGECRELGIIEMWDFARIDWCGLILLIEAFEEVRLPLSVVLL